MKTILLLFVCAMVFVGAHGHGIKPERTVIAGRVVNFSDDIGALIVNYCDPLSNIHRGTRKLNGSDGAFHFVHDYAFAQDLSIELGDAFVKVHVTPGDSIFIRIDAHELMRGTADAVAFSGDNAALNREMNDWAHHRPGHDGSMVFDTDVPSAELQARIRENFDAMRGRIDEYAAATGMSDRAREWACLDHKFAVANQIGGYRGVDGWDIFTGPLFDVFEPDNLRTQMFQYHLGYCVGALIRNDAELMRLAVEKDTRSMITALIATLHAKAPVGIVRDLMIYSYFGDRLGSVPELHRASSEIVSAISDPVLAERFGAMAGKSARPMPSGGVPSGGVSYLGDDGVESLPGVDVMEYLRRRYAGKVIYIDLWATWCAPCLAEMEHMPELHEYFEGEDVVFVNLCGQSEAGTWVPTLYRNRIDGENYFLGGEATGLFMGEYNLTGFPSYVSVGRDGAIHPAAPRPSNIAAAIETIEELLK